MSDSPQITGINSPDEEGYQLLAPYLGEPMPPDRFLPLAISITSALAKLHQQDLTHENLTPSTILLRPETGEVKLVSSFSANLPFPHPSTMDLALPYISPEQTGRLNLALDQRSDLYSLGVIFYQMLTGGLPCVADDLLQWVHCHIAHPPRPLKELAPEVPALLSGIVMKLLEKNAQERYQTAAGLQSDLENAWEQWGAKGRIEPFPLGQKDHPERLLIPQKLYGRERDLQLLEEAFCRVAETGNPELVLVGGYAGIGKSTLVRQMYRPVLRDGGRFVSGKYDQYRRHIPYSTFAQALRELVRDMLSANSGRIVRWKEEIQSAVGLNGRLLADLVPELELVIGKQPPVPELASSEAQSRFFHIVQRFLGVFSKEEHPLVIFLDDLQWCDVGSLRLVTFLLSQPETRHLLVIGAYRDNEVSPSHPLQVELSQIPPEMVRTLTLPPLTLEQLGEMLADSFATDPETVEPLAKLVQEKTGGNPFFVVQFLQVLYEERLVRFDPEERLWKWEMGSIQDKGYTDNLAELMAGKLKRLSERGLQETKLAACIGGRFDLKTLAMISELPEQEVRESLDEAVREGLLLRLEGGWAFLHDRIQEAAYSLVPENDRPGLHLRIGRLMLSQLSQEEVEERVLDVVDQLDRGVELVLSPEEREQVARLNLLAARRARGATGYFPALHYLRVGRSLLSEDAWERAYDLAFPMELLTAECEFLTGDLEKAKERLAHLSARGLDLVDGSAVTCLLIDLFITHYGRDPAVQAGLEYLRRGEIDWPPHPGNEAVHAEFDRMWQTLGGRSPEELVELPLMSDARWQGVIDVLARLIPPTIHTDNNLSTMVICRMVALSVEQGNSDGSSLAYVWLGLVLGPRFGDYSPACRFAGVGRDLVERQGLERYKARVNLDSSHAIVLLKQPLRTGPALVRRALEVAEERGDLTFMGYSSCNLVSALLSAGAPLAQVREAAERGLDLTRKVRFGMITDIIAGQLGLIRMLEGLTPDFSSFNSPYFDEGEFERHLEEYPGMAVARCWYWVRKLQGRYLSGDYPAALQAAGRTAEVLWTIPTHLEEADYHFFAALASSAYYPSAPPGERAPLMQAVQEHLAKHRHWEELAPANFGDRTALLSAELARLEGREIDAELLYEKALRLARENSLLQNEALAYELASRFYRERGFPTFADTYLRHAISRYQRWGALGKVRLLEQQAPWQKVSTDGIAIAHLDAITVIRASQAISQEMLLSDLLNTLMRMVLENAGAQKGALVLVKGEELAVAAQARVEGEKIEVVLEPTLPLAELIPASIVNYVRRTGDKVILHDASEPNPFSADECLARSKTLSVLCLPVLRQGVMVGILYLENDLVKGLFSDERVAILEAVSAQAAISLENSRLYAALKESERNYRDLSENLEQRVKEAVEEVAEKNRLLVLQSRQAIMGEMLGNIAHQWRQPLNSLGLLAQELKMTSKLKTMTPESLDANVKKTMEIIRHMSKTIDDFRYFFKPEKEKVPFRLLEVLEKALSLLQGTFHAYGITVETVATGDPVLEGYPNEYSQVLLNILNNAKDAMISRKVPEPKIVIGVGASDGRSVVTIADNAGGIPPEIIDKIFDLYFTTKGPEHGTGVGLFMCKSIIEKNMGGTLTVRNNGEGAEFRIEV